MKKLFAFFILILAIHCNQMEQEGTLVMTLHPVHVKQMRKNFKMMKAMHRFHHTKEVFLKGLKNPHKKIFAAKANIHQHQNKMLKMLSSKTTMKFKDSKISIAKINLMNYADIQYWGGIQIGKSKENFNVLLDTGSSWMWVPAKNCKGCHDAGIKNYFSCQKSSKCKKDPVMIEIEYGKGSISGDIAYDDVHVGESILQNQPFLEVEKISEDMPTLMFDGLIGLAPSDNMMKYPTFLHNLKEHNVIKKRSFSVYLAQKDANKHKPFVMFGGYNKDLMTDDKFHYCKRTGDDYWGTNLEGITLTGKESTLLPTSSKTALLDTGTSLVTFPERDYKSFLAEMKKIDSKCYFDAEEFETICPGINSLKKLPTISFNLCGKQFSLDPSVYAHRDTKDGKKVSMMKIGFLDLEGDPVILGDPFLQEFYTYYDLEENRIGISKSK